MSTAAVGGALRAAAEVVGADRVLEPGELGPNVSLFRTRQVAGLIRPRTAEEVRRLVEIFAAPDAGSLHPFGTGRNWGLGSREPVRDGVVALDLSGLDQVRAFDVAGGWAVVEPGVSQGRLSRLLDGTERMVNVTSSSADSGVLGNALDRGVGLRHQRVDDLLGLEVAVPNGELIRVGWWPDERRETAVYPYGLGPALTQLFVQSNLGVVTAATVRLLPRPEALRVVRLNFLPQQLPQAVTELRRWVAQGLVKGVLKVYNPIAARAYGSAEDEFLVHVCVDGTAAVVAALTEAVATEAAKSGLFTAVSSTDTDTVAGLVERSYAGDPDGDDVLFQAKLGKPADQVDEQAGFLFFLPLVPFNGQALARAGELLDQVAEATGIRCGATLHALGPDVIDYVVTMKFSRDQESAERAHRALDLLYQLFAAAGFGPYRLDVDHADWIDRLTSDPQALGLVRRLKDFLDPHSAIAPGRYR